MLLCFVQYVWVVIDEGEVLPPVVSTEIVFDTNLFIKWPLLMCADGGIAPLVFLLQWPSMPPEMFVWIEVAGLTNTTNSAAKGYLLLTTTRCGNAASWRFFFANFVLPHIKEHQDALELTESYLNMDGEAIVLAAIMETTAEQGSGEEPGAAAAAAVAAAVGEARDAALPAAAADDDGAAVDVIPAGRTVIQLMNEQRLTGAKLGAGRSIGEQAADGCKGGFKGTKAYMNKIAREDINTENKPLEERIIKKLQEASLFPLPAGDIRKLAQGLCTIVYAMKNSDAMHPAVIQRAFTIVGQHAKQRGEKDYEEPEYPVLNLDDPTVNVGRLLTNNLCQNTDGEILQMVESLPEACIIFERNGTLTREDMDNLHIPRLDDGTPARDGLQLWRQGSVILTSDATMQRLQKFREQRRPRTAAEQAAAAAEAARVKALLDAQKLLDAAEVGQAKKRQKSDSLQAEKVRRAGLSPAEKAAEDDAKKVQAAAKKLAKAAALAEALEAAEAVAAGADGVVVAGAAAVLAIRAERAAGGRGGASGNGAGERVHGSGGRGRGAAGGRGVEGGRGHG